MSQQLCYVYKQVLTRSFSFLFFLFFFFFQLKINRPKAWRNGSGLHPELHKQMCEQLETPHGRKLKVGTFPNEPDGCGSEEHKPSDLPCLPSLPQGEHLLESHSLNPAGMWHWGAALGHGGTGLLHLLWGDGIRKLFLAGRALGNELPALDIKPWSCLNIIFVLRSHGKSQKYPLR